MRLRLALFLLLLTALGWLAAACGNPSQDQRLPGGGLQPQRPAPATVDEETAFVQDGVLVTFRKQRVNEFQSTKLLWEGSVQNLGNTVKNARFEVLTTRQPIFRGELQTKIEQVQRFGDLQQGQRYLLNIGFSFPSTHALAVSARFVHD